MFILLDRLHITPISKSTYFNCTVLQILTKRPKLYEMYVHNVGIASIHVHACTCACMYLCMHVPVHACTCACMYVCMHVPVHVREHV